MNVALVSIFRNSCGSNLYRWITQVTNLLDYLSFQSNYQYNLRLIAVEGDSVDNTLRDLTKLSTSLPITILICNHGGPVYGSTEDSNRLSALSKVGDTWLSAITEQDDYVIYVESDLIWDSQTLLSLLDILSASNQCDIVSPLIFAGPNFYDVWGFRRNGQRFSPYHPYHKDLQSLQLLEVDSVGSCLAMRSIVARSCRMRDQALVGFCTDARSKGYVIKVAPYLSIKHPV